MSTTDTRAEQIEALANEVGYPQAQFLWEQVIAAMIAQAERAAAVKALRDAAEETFTVTIRGQKRGDDTTQERKVFSSDTRAALNARADRIEAGQ